MLAILKKYKYKNRVLLLGFPEINLGDDLFFKIILDRYPNTLFVLLAFNEYKEIFKDYDNVIVVNKGNLLYRLNSRLSYYYEKRTYYVPPTLVIRFLQCIFSFTHTVFVGGSMFQESCEKDRGLESLSSFKKMRNILKKCNFSMIGCNFGPYTTLDYCKNTGEIFKLMDDVCMRDKVSYEKFSYLGNVRFANDIVLHMKTEPSSSHGDYITISIIKPNDKIGLGHLENLYINKIIEFIRYYNKKRKKVVLMSFCKSLGDEIVLDQIKKLVISENANIEYFYYNGNLDKALEIISKSQMMIGTRFHSVILSFVYNVPVIPVAYSNKTKDMLLNYGLWNEIFEITNFVNLPIETLERETIQRVDIHKENNNQFKNLDISLK